MRTSAVEVSIQAVSPVSSLGLSSAASATAGRSSRPVAPRPARAEPNIRFIDLPSELAFVVASCWSECLGTGLARANADGLLDRKHEDLAVADLVRSRGLQQGLNRALDEPIVDHDLDLDLGQKAHGIFGAAIDLGLAFLPAESFH